MTQLIEIEKSMSSHNLDNPLFFPTWLHALRRRTDGESNSGQWGGRLREIKDKVDQTGAHLSGMLSSLDEASRLNTSRLDDLSERMEQMETSIAAMASNLQSTLQQSMSKYAAEMEAMTSSVRGIMSGGGAAAARPPSHMLAAPFPSLPPQPRRPKMSLGQAVSSGTDLGGPAAGSGRQEQPSGPSSLRTSTSAKSAPAEPASSVFGPFSSPPAIPASGAPQEMKGWLYKRSEARAPLDTLRHLPVPAHADAVLPCVSPQHMRRLNRRYVVLTNGVLAWFDSDAAIKPMNKMPVAGAIALAVAPLSATESSTGRFAFTVTFAPSAQHAPLYLEAETESERNAWLGALQPYGSAIRLPGM